MRDNSDVIVTEDEIVLKIKVPLSYQIELEKAGLTEFDVPFVEYLYYLENVHFAEYVKRTMRKHHVSLWMALSFALTKDVWKFLEEEEHKLSGELSYLASFGGHDRPDRPEADEIFDDKSC